MTFTTAEYPASPASGSPSTPSSAPSSVAAAAAAAPLATTRDPRLDFFRGIAMFIILIAHIPSNWLALWIPARFGFSDATETFVFCSGMASAMAFGKVFRERGMMMGTARLAYRVWQVYWAHIGLFFAIAVTMAALNMALPEGRDYIGQLNLYPFFKNTQDQLVGLFTLTYVPNYFDILPMYLVILAMMPVMVGLARIHVGLTAVAVLSIWALANVWGVNLPAEPWSDRMWFFNPLGWQLVFFTGFAFVMGWIPPPPKNRILVWICVAIVVVSLPYAYFRILNAVPFFSDGRRVIADLVGKSNFGILRYVHFLATAYLAWVIVGPKGAHIRASNHPGIAATLWRLILAAIMKTGQQSLAVFIVSMFVARLLGVAFDYAGRTHFTMFAINAFGILVVVAAAYGAGWFKSQPWRKARP